MSIHFSQSKIEARLDSGYYPPERLAMLKRVFEKTCMEVGIVEQAERDDLAVKILTASKSIQEEDAVISFAKFASYRLLGF